MTAPRRCVASDPPTSGMAMVKQVFSNGTIPNLASSISGTVLPRPLGYCSVAITGISMIFAAFSTRFELKTILSKWAIIGLNFSCEEERSLHC